MRVWWVGLNLLIDGAEKSIVGQFCAVIDRVGGVKIGWGGA